MQKCFAVKELDGATYSELGWRGMDNRFTGLAEAEIAGPCDGRSGGSQHRLLLDRGAITIMVAGPS